MKENVYIHALVREPEYLSTIELLTSTGFIRMVSIIMIPIVLVFIMCILIKKRKKLKLEKALISIKKIELNNRARR